jgi:hypothetical protein
MRHAPSHHFVTGLTTTPLPPQPSDGRVTGTGNARDRLSDDLHGSAVPTSHAAQLAAPFGPRDPNGTAPEETVAAARSDAATASGRQDGARQPM